MNEIGGYFGLEQFVNNEYYKELISLNTGRNALLYLIKAKKIRKLYIPYYLCNSVRDMLTKNKCDFEYYNIGSDFMPIFKEGLKNDEYLYIVNYYGQLNINNVISLKQKYQKIILDNTHAFFQKPVSNIDTIYTCRKYFGVPDGAYLSTNIKINDNIEIDISKDRMQHILGRYEGTASEYYSHFQNNDKSFKTEPLKYMSKLTHNILGVIDYERVKQIRNENYKYLESKLKDINRLKLITPEGAFAYPLYTENGIEIRKVMAEKKIYIPTLWSNVIDEMSKDSIEYQYAANVLPIPCDQRYGIEDMEYLAEELNN